MMLNGRKIFLTSNSREYILQRCSSSTTRAMDDQYPVRLIERDLSNPETRCTRPHKRLNTSRRSSLPRFYSSKSEMNAGDHKENTAEPMSHNDTQSGTMKHDQSEGLAAEQLSELSTRGARFRDEFLRMIVPWDKIPDVSLQSFPYYIHERTKAHLVECVASHLKQNKLRKYGRHLASSSNRILLQSIPGTGLYRERLVGALAREFQVPLLKIDGSVLPAYDLNSEEGKSDDESSESDSETEDENDTTDEERTDDSDKKVDIDTICRLKKGDRVKYVGPTTSIKEVNNRTLSRNQRGEVYEVNGDKVAVIFHINGLATEKDEKSTETAAKALVTWLDVKHVKHDRDAQTHDCFIAMEVLYEVLESQQPIVVYFPDSFLWLSEKASYKTNKKFVRKVQKILDELSGHVWICGQNNWEAGSEDMDKFPDSLKQYIKRLKVPTWYEKHHMCKLFTNVMYTKPPKDQDLLSTFVKQIEEDKITVISQGNLSEMRKVLKEHDLICMDLEKANIDDMILTRRGVKEIVGWATNHYLSSCPLPCVKEDLLHVPHESLKLAISRLKEQELESKNPSNSIKDRATDEYERRFVSAVVHPDDIGVKFGDVGALEHVKKALYELVILPMRRPELFSSGNLLRPCKGLLLFGPPGTGKTLIAKALATEAGANFINITAASLTNMWYGEGEKLTRALFSYASKLAPVIIFVDEVDALLGARGKYEHEATRKMRNEFMAAWDGLTSKESQRILIIGATNRPFDLDDAVIRRMPRRIYVGLPDVVNRSKILKILLAKENLESGFSFEQLAEATEGYSGSDLKNLCVAAAYEPVQELLEKESKGEICDGVPAIRPLNVDDFIHSKVKVGPSVSYNTCSMSELRKWNEQFGEGGSRGRSQFA